MNIFSTVFRFQNRIYLYRLLYILFRYFHNKQPYSVIIGHRGTKSWRLWNLVTVLKNYHSDRYCREIILVEQDESPNLRHFQIGKIKYIHNKNNGPYNRSQNFNIGASFSQTQNLIFADNDVILPHNNLSIAIILLKYYQAIKPFHFVFDTSPETTRLYRNTKKQFILIDQRGTIRYGTTIGGGVVIIRKKTFSKIHGWDERFVGWGGEDNAFTMKLIKNNIRTHEIQKAGFHLYHDDAKRTNLNCPLYIKNTELLRSYLETSQNTE
jgi:predicted glycosyltransferase involved in capsule biosynthesis